MDIYVGIMSFFIKGGVFMAPIGIVGALALAIAVERYVTLTRLVVTNRRAWNDVEPAISNADFDAAREKTSKSDTIVARLLGIGLARLGAVRRIDDIEKALRANLMEVIPQLEKRTHYLATFANLATLLGLLGTVSGLIHAFTAVATANPAEKANLLAGQHLRGHELYGVRPDGRRAAAVHAFVPAVEDRAADREPRDRRGQVPDPRGGSPVGQGAGASGRGAGRARRLALVRPGSAAEPVRSA